MTYNKSTPGCPSHDGALQQLCAAEPRKQDERSAVKVKRVKRVARVVAIGPASGHHGALEVSLREVALELIQVGGQEIREVVQLQVLDVRLLTGRQEA